MTSHHVNHILFTKNESISPAHKPAFKGWGLHKSVDTRRWGPHNLLLNCFFSSVVIWVFPEADPKERIQLWIVNLQDDPRKIWEQLGMWDRKGKETHKGNVFKLGTALGSWSSILLGDLGNNIEHCYPSEGCRKLGYLSKNFASIIGWGLLVGEITLWHSCLFYIC